MTSFRAAQTGEKEEHEESISKEEKTRKEFVSDV